VKTFIVVPTQVGIAILSRIFNSSLRIYNKDYSVGCCLAPVLQGLFYFYPNAYLRYKNCHRAFYDYLCALDNSWLGEQVRSCKNVNKNPARHKVKY
jgi:hypothetical protein